MNFLLGSTGLVGSLLVQELKNNEETLLDINRRNVDYLSDDEQVVIDEIDNFNFFDAGKRYISLGYPLKWNELIFMKKAIINVFF